MCKICNDTGVCFYSADTGEQIGYPCSCGISGYNDYIKQKYGKSKIKRCDNPTGLLGIQNILTKDKIFVEINTSLDTTLSEINAIDLSKKELRRLFLIY